MNVKLKGTTKTILVLSELTAVGFLWYVTNWKVALLTHALISIKQLIKYVNETK